MARTALALVLLGTLACCGIAPPTKDAWLAVGFRTPRQTFATFQTGLRADLPDLEYRTLAQSWKAAEGLNQLAYRAFRQELFDENPWLRYAAEAEVVEELPLAPGRVRLIARVRKLFVERSFAVDLMREDFYELYEAGELLDDGFATFERSADSPAPGELRVSLPLPFGAEPTALSEARLGREWKITGFAAVEATEEPREPPASTATP